MPNGRATFPSDAEWTSQTWIGTPPCGRETRKSTRDGGGTLGGIVGMLSNAVLQARNATHVVVFPVRHGDAAPVLMGTRPLSLDE